MKQKNLKKVTHLFDEQTERYLPTIDKIKEFKKVSKISFTRQFKNLKVEKKSELRKLKKNGNPPIPGGVGYGVYFKKEYHWAFTNFSCLDFCILAPEVIGGNSETYLYLTATNGAAKGVEALLSYYAQQGPVFKIFDWAKPEAEKWSLSIDCSELKDNFSRITIEGIVHNYCRFINKTEMIAPNLWENKVYLLNFKGDNWDLVYKYQYECTLTQQKNEFYGSWGPIVETFQPTFTDLSPIGFYKCLLYNDKVNALLTPTNSKIRDDIDGIDIVYKESNHTFLVR